MGTNGRRVSRLLFPLLALVALSWECTEDRSRSQSPTAPGAASARISGTLVRAGGAGEPLSGVTVTLVPGERTALTDASGGFLFENVAPGAMTLRFDGPGIRASVPLAVAGGDVRIRVSGSRNTATLGPRGEDHAGRVEGIITAITPPSLTVAGVMVTTSAATVIRHGDMLLKLSDLHIGDRAEVEGTLQKDGSILADKIEVEENEVRKTPTPTPTPVGPTATPGTPTTTPTPRPEDAEVKGTITSLGTNTFQLSTAKGPVMVTVNSLTRFEKEHDMAATFSDLKMGQSVEVEGTLLSPGSILAREVKIED